jgi:hypothetical protein
MGALGQKGAHHPGQDIAAAAAGEDRAAEKTVVGHAFGIDTGKRPFAHGGMTGISQGTEAKVFPFVRGEDQRAPGHGGEVFMQGVGIENCREFGLI